MERLHVGLVAGVGADGGARRVLSPPASFPGGVTSRMITDFEVGQLLPIAVESSGTRGFVSG